jgi:hypothetical protein
MARLISGVFHDAIEAERTLEELEDLGYARAEISVVTADSAGADATVPAGAILIGVTARPGDEPNVRAILEEGSVLYGNDDDDRAGETMHRFAR